jgi:thymidylate synthase
MLNEGKFSTIDDLWCNTIDALLHAPEVPTRIGPSKELLGYRAVLANVEQNFLLNPRRKLSPVYACAEVLWYLTCTKSIEMISAYAPQYVKFAEDGKAHGAYGFRINRTLSESVHQGQLELLIECLKKDNYSRQAVLVIWDKSDLWHAVQKNRKDIPCTLTLQFLIREHKLNLIATIRSNDAWLGLPYDIFAFTCIQRFVASALGIQCGVYVHQAGSEHLYEKNWRAAREAIGCVYTSDFRRLEHTWALGYTSQPLHAAHLAVTAERMYREGDSGASSVLANLHLAQDTDITMLNDLVACAATKWDTNLTIHSPLLKEALKCLS